MIPEHFEMIRRRRERFWWYVGRRDLFSRMLAKHLSGPVPVGLDGGCGPGTNEALYGPFANRWICGDLDGESFSPWRPGALGQGIRADIGHLPARDTSADLVLLLDVLEHLADESPGLREVRRVLKPGGVLLVSVPAFRALWSWHDVQAGHHRRYRLGEIVGLVEREGFKILDARYFNCLLSAPIFAIRKVALRIPSMRGQIEAELSPGLLNAPLRAYLELENRLGCAGIRWPFGTTAALVARKQGTGDRM